MGGAPWARLAPTRGRDRAFGGGGARAQRAPLGEAEARLRAEAELTLHELAEATAL